MADLHESEATAIVEGLAARARPADLTRLDAQFERKLSEVAGRPGTATMIETLRLFWRMLKADDALVPWSDKAWMMAAISYFVSPLDAIPDLVKPGYFDDALVVRLARGRIQPTIDAFLARDQRRA